LDKGFIVWAVSELWLAFACKAKQMLVAFGVGWTKKEARLVARLLYGVSDSEDYPVRKASGIEWLSVFI